MDELCPHRLYSHRRLFEKRWLSRNHSDTQHNPKLPQHIVRLHSVERCIEKAQRKKHHRAKRRCTIPAFELLQPSFGQRCCQGLEPKQHYHHKEIYGLPVRAIPLLLPATLQQQTESDEEIGTKDIRYRQWFCNSQGIQPKRKHGSTTRKLHIYRTLTPRLQDRKNTILLQIEKRQRNGLRNPQWHHHRTPYTSMLRPKQPQDRETRSGQHSGMCRRTEMQKPNHSYRQRRTHNRKARLQHKCYPGLEVLTKDKRIF